MTQSALSEINELGNRQPSRWNIRTIPERVRLRAFSKCMKQSDGCWISEYSVGSHGYAQVGWSEGGKCRTALAHRAAWEYANGAVPVSMTLDHVCKERKCVNPDHLRLLPNFENSRRNNGHDWEFGTCRKGHPDSSLVEVTRTAKSGRKYRGLTCRECGVESRRKWEMENPEKLRSYRESNIEIGRARKRKYYLANRERILEKVRLRQQVKRGSEGVA